MRNNKKGILLLFVLFTATLISIFLIAAVNNMHNNFFITKKFIGENKAYWAAEAGLQYCKYKLKSDLAWPFSDSTSTDTETFGSFDITSSTHGDYGYYIHGTSKKTEQEFHIYFSKKEKDDDTDLVPSSFPSEAKNVSYCSYNSRQINKF